ncbi:MAG: glutaredoxin family protein [Pseudomonadota bacterium]
MPTKILLGAILTLLCLANSEAAVTVVECMDSDANKSFNDRCAPEETQTDEVTIAGVDAAPKTLEEIIAKFPVVLYSASICDACDLVRSQLVKRQIPFAEKNVEQDPDAAEGLVNAQGQVSVPILNVGEDRIDGFDRDAIHNLLNRVGYPQAVETSDANAY